MEATCLLERGAAYLPKQALLVLGGIGDIRRHCWSAVVWSAGGVGWCSDRGAGLGESLLHIAAASIGLRRVGVTNF